ncbi:MAG: PQQ-binding-like beta-propeller repeat protein [Planctomycetia bacterium]|nr:PQQ-binding-like beta-propeller repeat protein [Planctomycetia bacterium]
MRFSLPTRPWLRTLRATFAVSAAALLVAGCSGTRGEPLARGDASARTWVSGSGGAYVGAAAMDPGEVLLENLPWSPDVFRVNLGAGKPGFALAQVYAMADDVLAVDTQGTIYCLSRRDLSPRWVSSLRAPLSAPIAEGPTYYVCLERDACGAAWVEWFSKRSGAPGNASPARLPFAPSSGISANAGWAFVGSLGSPIDNKTVEAINLADGKVGWGYRTMSRVSATPTVDPSGEILLVVGENRTITSLPTNQSGVPVKINWAVDTLGVNTAAPAMAREWAFIGSEDNLLRCIDIGSGETRWLKGLDAPARKTPWVVGRTVVKNVPTGGEGSPMARVESFEGYVFAKNAIGLHAFDADTGAEVFKDRNGLRPLVMERDWVVTLTENKQAQIRKGKGLPVVSTADFSRFDFLPTNGRDGEVIAGYANGVILLAAPK